MSNPFPRYNHHGTSGTMEGSFLPPRSAQRFAQSAQATQAPARGEPVTLKDERTLWLRPIAPGDVDAIRRCFTRLSADEIRRRFLHHMRELPVPVATQLCSLDPDSEVADVLVDDTVTPAEIRGVGRIHVDRTCDHAEFAVLVEKDWTGLGLGALLMQRLVDECKRRNVARVWGYVLTANRPMLDLCQRMGFTQRPMDSDRGTAMIALDLD